MRPGSLVLRSNCGKPSAFFQPVPGSPRLPATLMEKTLRGPRGKAASRYGKGGPIESRPIVKSEFRQTLPDRLQLLDRIALMWSICLSTIGQSGL